MEILHLFLLFLATIIFFTNLLFKKPKNLPPSPPSLPVIGHLHLLKKPPFRSLAKISDKYGPIVSLRFGSRPVILVSSPSLVEECLTQTNDVIFANRPRFLIGKHMGYNYTALVSSPYGHNYRFLRRIITLEMLSSNRLQMLSNIRTEEIASMINQLKRKSESSEYEYQTVDMKQTLFQMNLNLMMRMIAGKRYYGEKAEDMEETIRFQEMVEESLKLMASTNVGDFIPVLKWLGFNGLEKRILRLMEKREVILQELIDNLRRNEERTKSTMMDVLLSLQKNEPECYTDQMIKGLIWVLITGGTDTSAGTMEWTMSLLVNNPKVLKKAQAEIDNHIGQEHRLLQESDLSKLPYLHAIIIETLRLYPAGPLLMPHQSSEECTIGGYKIAPGTMLLVNLWGIQNNPKLWDDPTEFKPERFEKLEGERREGFKLMPFGTGRRGCPGEGLAIRMVGLGLGCLIQCFEWERLGEDLVDMSEGIGLTLPRAKPLKIKYRPRSNMVDFLSQL